MAEASVETVPSAARFFCHKCNVEITPQLPSYVCPRCNSGFIEELEGPGSDIDAQDTDSDSSSDMEIEPYDVQNMLRDVLAHDLSSQGSGTSLANGQSTAGLRRSQRLRHPLNPRPGRRRVSGDRNSALAPLLHDLIMQMTSGVIEASVGGSDFGGLTVGFDLPRFPVLVASNLISNPGDYAWGRGGLDAIISQLMNQLDGTGPPPLPQEKIDKIPTVEIKQEQCDQGLQCSVCMEDFKVQEAVRQLNCEHCYHPECIIPWLELHGTCPVCRKSLMDPGIGVVTPNTSSGDNGSLPFGAQAGPSSSSSSGSSSSSNSSARSTRTPSGRHRSDLYEEDLD